MATLKELEDKLNELAETVNTLAEKLDELSTNLTTNNERLNDVEADMGNVAERLNSNGTVAYDTTDDGKVINPEHNKYALYVDSNNDIVKDPNAA